MKDNHNSIDNLYNKKPLETSPIVLDNLILNQAKQSCEPKIVQTKPRRWLYSVATAAVFVMGFIVMFNLQTQHSDMQVTPKYNESKEPKKQVKITHFETSAVRHYSAPPLEPHPVSKNNKQLTGRFKNKSNLTFGQTVKDTQMKLPTIQTDNEEKLTVTKTKTRQPKTDVLLSTQESTSGLSETTESENLTIEPLRGFISDKEQRVMLTGTRTKTSKPIIALEIKRLEAMISNKKFSKANQLVTQLKLDYPDYDFSKQEKQIK